MILTVKTDVVKTAQSFTCHTCGLVVKQYAAIRVSLGRKQKHGALAEHESTKYTCLRCAQVQVGALKLYNAAIRKCKEEDFTLW